MILRCLCVPYLSRIHISLRTNVTQGRGVKKGEREREKIFFCCCKHHKPTTEAEEREKRERERELTKKTHKLTNPQLFSFSLSYPKMREKAFYALSSVRCHPDAKRFFFSLPRKKKKEHIFFQCGISGCALHTNLVFPLSLSLLSPSHLARFQNDVKQKRVRHLRHWGGEGEFLFHFNSFHLFAKKERKRKVPTFVSRFYF